MLVAVRARARGRGGRRHLAATSSSAASTRGPAQYYTHYHFEGIGWGGRATTDGNDAQIVPHGNCHNTPVEVFETRYPWLTRRYRLNPDGGGAGRTRGGLGITRVMTVEADEIVVSALCDRSKVAPWGLFGGGDGRAGVACRRRAEAERFRTFREAFGTPSDTKFSERAAARAATRCCLRSPSGGGYGPTRWSATRSACAADVREGFVTAEAARERYGVALTADGRVDAAATDRLRWGGRLMAWVERDEAWHRIDVAYCEVTGQLLPRRYWEFEHEGRTVRARDPHCEELYHWYVLPRAAGAHQSPTAPSP